LPIRSPKDDLAVHPAQVRREAGQIPLARHLGEAPQVEAIETHRRLDPRKWRLPEPPLERLAGLALALLVARLPTLFAVRLGLARLEALASRADLVESILATRELRRQLIALCLLTCAFTFVPSTATVPSFTRPTSRAIRTTGTNSSGNSGRCR
jgi:hypothetical protein